MAKENDDEKDKYVYAGDKDSGYKVFPKKPSTWDYVKEGFEPTATRVMLDQVRKRRQGLND